MAQLKAAWKRASNLDKPEPQLVVLVGESGLGKTRITQEFYNWLSTTEDPAEPGGYWPDDLGQDEDNLKVNPDPEACDNRERMPFLWWGIRLADPSSRNAVQTGSALSANLPHLLPHLEPVLKRTRNKERLKSGGKTLAKAAVDLALPGLSTIVDLVSLGKESLSDQRASSTREIHEEERKSQSEMVLNALSTMVGGLAALEPVPACLLIDDAQFSRTDQALTGFVEKLIARAFTQKWPLLIIVTHWHREWREDWAGTHPSVALAIRNQLHQLAETWQAIELAPIDDLGPLLQRALPGLLPEQSKALQARAGGNPRYLDEIVRFCLRQPRHFVERDLKRALSDKGFAACLKQSLSLHELVLDRYDAMPREIKETMALSSLQGHRFLTALTIEVARALKVHNAEAGLDGAEDPHGLVKGVPSGIAEFAQRIFHEVANEALDDLVDREEALEAMKETIRQGLEEEMETPTSDVQQREMILAIVAGQFERAEAAEDRQRAARAFAELIRIEQARYDFSRALQLAQHVMAGIEADQWQFSSLSFSQLQTLQSVLHTMGHFSESQQVADAMLASAQQSVSLAADDREAQLNLSHSWITLGDLARGRGQYDEARAFFQKSQSICETLAAGKNTPAARRGLATSWERLGDIASRQGRLDDANAFFHKRLAISQALAAELNTPQASMDLFVSWDKLGDTANKQGDLGAAKEFFQKGLLISEPLAAELNTPVARRDLSLSWSKLGDIARKQGDLEGARQFFLKRLAISQALAAELNTPQARRGLFVAWIKLGDIAREQGDLDGAKTAFEKALDVDEVLATELNTPYARWGLFVSWDRLGHILHEQGDLDGAKKLFRRVLSSAKRWLPN